MSAAEFKDSEPELSYREVGYGNPGEKTGQSYGQPYGMQYGQQYPQSGQYGPNTMVVTTQPNVKVVQPGPPPPNNYMVLAIVICIFCFLPFGVFAVLCSSQSSDAARAGDMETARRKAKISLGLSISSILGAVLPTGIFLALYWGLDFESLRY